MKKIMIGIVMLLSVMFVGIGNAKAYTGNVTFGIDDKRGSDGTEKLYVKAYMNNGVQKFDAYKDEKMTIKTTSIEVPTLSGKGFEGYYINGVKLITRRGNIKVQAMEKYLSTMAEGSAPVLVADYKDLKYKVSLVSKDVQLDENGTEEFYFAGRNEGVAYTYEGKIIDTIKKPKRKGYVFKGYEKITYQGQVYSTINEEGRILPVAYNSNTSLTPEADNAEGWRMKAVALGFYETGSQEIRLNSLWEKESEETKGQITKLEVSPLTNYVKKGGSVKLTYTKEPSTSTEEVKWTSSNNNIVSITEDGVVTGIRLGKAVVTVQSKTGKVEANGIVVVTSDGNPSSKEVLTIEVGQTVDVLDEIVTDGKSFQSDNLNIVTIANDTEATGVAVGTTTLRVFSDTRMLMGTIDVEVIKATDARIREEIEEEIEAEDPDTIEKDKSAVVICYMKDNNVAIGGSKKFEYKTKNFSGKVEKISVPDPTKSGIEYDTKTNKITGKEEGIYVLRLKLNKEEGTRDCYVLVGDPSKYQSQIEADTNINSMREKIEDVVDSDPTVTQETTTKGKITISGDSKVTVGKTITLKAKKKNVKGTVKWSSSDKKKATVSKKGVVKGKKAGKVTITAKIGNKAKATKKITVKKKKSNGNSNSGSSHNDLSNTETVTLYCDKTTIKVDQTTTCKAKGTSNIVKWSSGDKKIATVTSKGKVKGVKVGTVVITATVNKKEYTKSITVKKKDTGSTSTTGNNTTFKLKKRIYIGDSRTVGMHNTVGNHSMDIWSAQGSAGYDTYGNIKGIKDLTKAIESKIKKNRAVIFLFGANWVTHVYDTHKYQTFVNDKAKKWVKKGVRVYYVSVNPVEEKKQTNRSGRLSAKAVKKANKALKKYLSKNVTFIDSCSYLEKTGFKTADGIHYDGNTYKKIYNYINDQIAKDAKK